MPDNSQTANFFEALLDIVPDVGRDISDRMEKGVTKEQAIDALTDEIMQDIRDRDYGRYTRCRIFTTNSPD